MQIDQAHGRYIRWLLATRDLSPHTIRAYDADLASFQRYVGAGFAAAEIEQDDVISFIEREKAANLSPASLKRRAAALRGFCCWMLSQGLLAVDPWEWRKPRPGATPPAPSHLASSRTRPLNAVPCLDGRRQRQHGARQPDR